MRDVIKNKKSYEVVRDQQSYIDSRLFAASVVLFFSIILLSFRLWFIQIYKGPYYLEISQANRVRRVEIVAPRGRIYDRDNRIILGNKRMYDLVYIPQYVKDKKSTLEILTNLVHMPYEVLERKTKAFRSQVKFEPITLKKSLTSHERALVESYKHLMPGVEIQAVPKRFYNDDINVHLIGYLREHNFARGVRESDGYRYLPGDLSGKKGLELIWEKYLRGQRGYDYIQVDALGRKINPSIYGVDLFLSKEKEKSGSDLHLTIDWDLQIAAQKAFTGKYGAVVILNPQNGQVLGLVSSPWYNPRIYQGELTEDRWQMLVNNPFKPFFDKTTGGLFSPGSLFKPVVALAALEEGILKPESKSFCSGKYQVGSQTFHCHRRAGHGHVSLKEAMLYSCDTFFYSLGIELGLDKIGKYAEDFYLGHKLGLNLNRERAGLIPSKGWKQQRYRRYVSKGDLANMSIGQGDLLMTPIQLATFYATIANGGYVWRPYLVDQVKNSGKVLVQGESKLLHKVKHIKPENLHLMRNLLLASVDDPRSTGRRAKLPYTTVAGKTGSIQVVSLKKNRNRLEASNMKWQEHAMFAAFSPAEKAEIVVLVISENDPEGGGGAQSAPIAKKILDVYWQKKNKKAL